MKRRVYLSGRYNRRIEIISYKEMLEKYGNREIVSRWIWGSQVPIEDLVPGNANAESKARQNLADLERMDEFILFTGEPGRKGGDKVELGYALAKGVPITIIGTAPCETAFHCLPEITRYSDFQELFIT